MSDPRGSAQAWCAFDRHAERYDAWYETPRGQRAFAAEVRLLDWLLQAFPQAADAVEIGCGTGRFCEWLEGRGIRTLAFDRAPGMLAVLRRRRPGAFAVLADALQLPLPDRGVDLAVLVTSLEFVADVKAAMAEAVRVVRRGVVVLALNRWSVGALSRRLGPAARGMFLAGAQDLSPRRLRAELASAAGPRLRALRLRTVLSPRPWPTGPTRVPFGDVVGAAAMLEVGPGACDPRWSASGCTA